MHSLGIISGQFFKGFPDPLFTIVTLMIIIALICNSGFIFGEWEKIWFVLCEWHVERRVFDVVQLCALLYVIQ